MSFRSILASLRSAPKPPRRRASGCRAGFRPRLEPLEDRTVPATFTVSNLADAGNGSLRQAVLDANALPGADDIRFADGLQGTIALTGGQLSITDHLTIDGPGAGLLAVSGNHQSRVFNITGEAVAGIDDLTITGRAIGGDGNAQGGYVGMGIGGGLGNDGSNPSVAPGGSTITLLDSTVTNNQAVGGIGAAAHGGGVANVHGGVVHISDSTLAHNRARGGDGGDGLGGGLYNGVASTHPSNFNAPTVLTVEGSVITHNRAQGSAAGAGTAAGDGQGGGLWNGGTAVIRDTEISYNRALGGDGADGSGGGDGFGGGAYNAAAGWHRLERGTVTENHANGGEGDAGDGEGIGGGVHNLGLFDFDVLTLIFGNHASTSHDDVFSL
jgi:hypothetical protein